MQAAGTLGKAKGRLVKELASDAHCIFEAERLHDQIDVLDSRPKSSKLGR